VDPIGLVCERPPLSGAALPGVGDLVFGGHDVIDVQLRKRAEELSENGVIPGWLIPAIGDALDEVEHRIVPGVEPGTGESPEGSVERIARDLRSFKETTGADRVVVIDLSSTEPPIVPHPAHTSLLELRAAIHADEDVLPPSSLYAMAAFEEDCGFVSFTPSAGPRLPALDELARLKGVPYAGCDGKTGETLLRAAVAPMFVNRALRVRSWSGTNILGGGDGAALADSARAESKLRSKAGELERLIGAPVDAPLHIDYVEDMGDWKTSWDHISFEGFLGVKMKMQITWEGCDSALAAPLILDLARLVSAAHREGHGGPLPELGFFFKEALVDDQPADLGSQYDALCSFAASLGPQG
jgi:myo-inositol-1-phosphate synthase